MYVRRGGVVPPLSPLYQGPYRVLERSQKFLSLEVGGRTKVVSVDRLKPHLGKAPISPSTKWPASRPESSSGLQMTLQPLLGGGPLWRRGCAKQE